MKANEIMTGDYFRIAQTGKIIKIVAVDEPSGSVDYFDGDAGGVLTIGVEKIEPIPLTAEILEKNGFKKVAGDKYFPNPKYVWLGSEESECVVSIAVYDKPVNGVNVLTQIHTNCKEHGGVNKVHNCDIGYVHELQHALRLCGIDKEIVL